MIACNTQQLQQRGSSRSSRKSSARSKNWHLAPTLQRWITQEGAPRQLFSRRSLGLLVTHRFCTNTELLRSVNRNWSA